MGRGTQSFTIGRSALVAALLATTALPASMALTGAQAFAQSSAQTRFDVPAGPLSRALAAFGSQSGTQVSYEASIATGKTSAGIRGAATREEALARILQGSGLVYSFSNAASVVIADPVSAAHAPVDANGALVLGTIDVTAGGRSAGWDGSAESVYSTPDSVSHIAQETIERFRGQNAGDMFRGTPGVLSGENRNSGAVDVNIRGMQGMNRVPVTVDGAMNQTSVYRGYQGMSGRSYVDPDFIGGVSIEKGPTTGPGLSGIGGSVAMRTLNAGDIVQDGRRFGVRVKGELLSNTTDPEIGKIGGWTGSWARGYTPVNGEANRPSLLDFGSGSGSVVAGFTSDHVDLVAGFARRKTGNYHAGVHGPVAEIVNIGPWTNPSNGRVYPNRYENMGLSLYRGGEEVFNTSQDVTSAMLKGTFRFLDDHALELGVMTYSNDHGEITPWNYTTNAPERITQEELSRTRLDSYTARYKWDPAGNDLIHLRWNAWATNLTDLRPNWESYLQQQGIEFGSKTFTWGTDISNVSLFDTGIGDLTLEYGAGYSHEDSRPSDRDIRVDYPPRDGKREEFNAFTRAKLDVTDRWTVTGGLRYQYFRTEDRYRRVLRNIVDILPDGSVNLTPVYGEPSPPRSGDGFSPSLGLAYTPWEGIQVFANYKQGLRLPSLVESTRAMGYGFLPEVGPERAHNREIGLNIDRAGVFDGGDRLAVKLAYFNNRVDDYLARRSSDEADPEKPGYRLGLIIDNIEAAKFSGFEASAQYTIGGTTIGLSGSYFQNVEFCTRDEGCMSKTLSGDFANNQIPPKYMISLDVSQKLFDDALTLGGRVTHYGKRAIEGSAELSGAMTIITPIDWKPFTLVDIFAEYRLNENLTMNLSVENLTDQYYIDPLSLGIVPAPGRTVRAGLTARF